MKTLQIGLSWFQTRPGGTERYYSELVNALPLVGEDVVGIVYDLPESFQTDRMRLVSFGSGPYRKNFIKRCIDQRRIIRSNLDRSIDIIVSHYAPSIFPSLKDIKNRPLICHFLFSIFLLEQFDGNNKAKTLILKGIENSVYRRANHFIVLSSHSKSILVEKYNISEEKISVIPGGVNIGFFKQSITRKEARSILSLPKNRPIIMSVRRLVRRMGLENLIDGMVEVIKVHPEVLLIITGTGPLKEELRSRIESKGLSRNIVMMGFVSDELPIMYRASDFTVVPTVALEGFGLVIVESLACGIPVLGTPVAAIPEVLKPLSQSLLFESSSSQHIAEGIINALSGKVILPDIQQCENYSENFAWPIIAEKVRSVYRQVLGK